MTGPFVEFVDWNTGKPVTVNLSHVTRFLPALPQTHLNAETLAGITKICFDATDGLGGTDVETDAVWVKAPYAEVRQKFSDALFAANTGEVWR